MPELCSTAQAETKKQAEKADFIWRSRNNFHLLKEAFARQPVQSRATEPLIEAIEMAVPLCHGIGDDATGHFLENDTRTP